MAESTKAGEDATIAAGNPTASKDDDTEDSSRKGPSAIHDENRGSRAAKQARTTPPQQPRKKLRPSTDPPLAGGEPAAHEPPPSSSQGLAGTDPGSSTVTALSNEPNQAELRTITKPEEYRTYMDRAQLFIGQYEARIKELNPKVAVASVLAIVGSGISQEAMEKMFPGKSHDIELIHQDIKIAEEMLESDQERLKVLIGLKGAAEEMLQLRERTMKIDEPSSIERVAPADFRIEESKWRENASLESLGDRVRELFDWYAKSNKQKEYVAPYFPMVQSSGTGKTKLMYELSKRILQGDTPWQGYGCVLVLCINDASAETGKEVFHHKINFSKIVREYIPPQNEKPNWPKAVVAELERIVPKEQEKVVVFLDEAQNLLGTDTNAFAFRCIRRWLCKKTKSPKQVVAVFTGTTSALGNYYPDVKPREEVKVRDEFISSREYEIDAYLESGKRLYHPFHDTGSIGCLVDCISMKIESEFDRAVPYGRPLFATLHEEGRLENTEASIVRRILLYPPRGDAEQWKEVAWISVLATRVQMDLSSTQVISELVSRGYASLMDFQEVQLAEGQSYFAKMCFLPDPVLARLAMCLMDEDWSIRNETDNSDFQGQTKQWWVEKMHTLFSSRLCRAPKGDGGELFSALFMLFCMDEVRKELDKDYRTFSVPVIKWIEKMLSNCKVMTNDATMKDETPSNPSTKSKKTNTKDRDQTARRSNVPVVDGKRRCPIQSSTVNFIQVCRNFFRYPFLQYLDAKSGEAMFEKRFLKYLYNSATAFYTYQSCPRIDLFASIKIRTDKGKEIYRPLLVSVKARKDYSRTEAQGDCRKMLRMLQRNSLKRQSRMVTRSMQKYNDEARQHELNVKKEISGGLCILIVFGGSSDLEDINGKDLFGRLQYIDKVPVAVVIQVKENDRYDLGGTLLRTASDSRDVVEISHSSVFLRGHKFADFQENDLLRLKSCDKKFLGKIGSSLDKWHDEKPYPDNDDNDNDTDDEEEDDADEDDQKKQEEGKKEEGEDEEEEEEEEDDVNEDDEEEEEEEEEEDVNKDDEEGEEDNYKVGDDL